MTVVCEQAGGEKKHCLLRNVLFLLMVLFAASSYASELAIGLIPERDVFSQMKRYRILGDYIEQKTGTKITFTVLPRYGNILENYEQKKMHGAFWDSFAGALAIRQLDVKPVARPVYSEGGSAARGYIFVHKYSVIDNAERMKGSVIAFVDRATTAGYVFPMAFLRENGVGDIDEYFGDYYFTGSDEAAIYAVLQKKADIGCAVSTVFDALAAKTPEIKEDLQILAVSPEVPRNVLALSADIPLAVRESIKRALTGMDEDSEGKKIISEFGAVKFMESKEADFRTVFNIAGKAGLSPENYRYVNK